jgi:hypothetical protein
MAIARLSVKVGKAGKAAPHAEYIDRDEEKKLKQEQAETDLEHSAYGNMPKWAEHNPITFWQQPTFTSAKMAVPIENMKLPCLER